MKKSLMFRSLSFYSGIFLLLISTNIIRAQVPDGFNYQAIARDAGGAPVAGATLQVKVAVLSQELPEIIIWEELHSVVTTNSSGLFSLVIGTGVRQAGTATLFADIDWSVSPKYIRTSIYYNSGWINMGSAKLWSVPYAKIAGNLGGPLKKLAVTGQTTMMDEALFEVKNQTGQTVFAVYNEGVRVYVDNGAKGVKGGFAIGGFGTAKAPSQDLMMISPDSIRMYINDKPLVKGVKGGFAIGGFDNAKALKNREYLRVTEDSTRVYVSPPGAKGIKGGFAIGGYSTGKGASTNFMNLTPQNYFIGHESGAKMTTGLYNSFIGYQSGLANTAGARNVFLGYLSGNANSTGNDNTFIGNQTGALNTAGYSNVFIGNKAGQNNLTGNFNIIIGEQSGVSNNADYNVFLGWYAGNSNTSGTQNVFVGTAAGSTNTTGYGNVFVGNQSGTWNTVGNFNTYVGYLTGVQTTTGELNVAVGKEAGSQMTTGTENSFLGANSGFMNTSGINNSFFGSGAGRLNTFGINNVFAGRSAGLNNTIGSNNTFVGQAAGLSNQDASRSVMIGTGAGSQSVHGNENTLIGYQADAYGTGGYNTAFGTYAGIGLSTGERNVFLGYGAGSSETTGSNKLYIANQLFLDNTTSLIYGEFDTKYLRINGSVDINNTLNIKPPVSGITLKANGTEGISFDGAQFSWGGGGTSNYFAKNVGIGTTTPGVYKLYVNGNVAVVGTVTNPSDFRYKTNINPLAFSISDLGKLNPVTFNWKQSDYPEMNFDNQSQIGVIAQEIETIIPELVKTDEKGYKSVDYTRLSVVLLKVVQEQQASIEEMQKELNMLKEQVKKIR